MTDYFAAVKRAGERGECFICHRPYRGHRRHCDTCAGRIAERQRARRVRKWYPGSPGGIPANATAEERQEHERLRRQRAAAKGQWQPGKRGPIPASATAEQRAAHEAKIQPRQANRRR